MVLPSLGVKEMESRANEAMSRLGLGEVSSVQLATFSVGRAVFAVKAGSGRYFVKTYYEGQILRNEVANLALAAAAGIAVPQILSLEDGEAPAVLVLSAVPGRRISARDRTAWRELGLIVRRISEIEPPLGSRIPRWLELVVNRTREDLGAWASLGLIARRQVPVLVSRLGELGPILAARPMTFSHNDLQADHVLVDSDAGTLSGLVDWADARIADPLLDLAIVSMDSGTPTDELMNGFGDAGPGADQLVTWYRLLKRLSAATWLRRQARVDLAEVHEAQGLKLLSSL